MALAKCRECNASVSDEAKICPLCGISTPVKKTSAAMKFFLWLVGLSMLGNFIGLAMNKEGNTTSNQPSKGSNITPTTGTINTPLLAEPIQKISDKDYNTICKGAIAVDFGSKFSTIKIDKKYSPNLPTVKIHYIRDMDKTTWAFECKFVGSRVIWRALPGSTIDYVGRWRDGSNGFDEDDSNIQFSIIGEKIKISRIYPDDSGTEELYEKK